MARQLQEEENNQVQSTLDGERLSEQVAKQLDFDENQTIAKRVSKRTRAPRQPSTTSAATTQEKSASNMKLTKKKLTKKGKRLVPVNDGSDSVQMDVRKEGKDDVESPGKDGVDTIDIE